MKRVSPESPELWLAEVAMFQEFFPQEVLERLLLLAADLPERKTKFTASDTGGFPGVIAEAAALVEQTFGAPINTAIIKRYVPGEPSGAFEMHIDPDQYQGGIFLCSLSGQAKLWVASWNVGCLEFDCQPNTVIAMTADKPHMVSEPVAEFGTRTLLFFGHSCPNVRV